MRNAFKLLIVSAIYPVLSAATAYYQPVDSVAAMQALGTSSKLISNVDVVSYVAGLNVGGGKFHYDPSSTSTVDGCNIFSATGVATGRWIRIGSYNSPYPVVNCGVVADGTISDVAPLQRALDLGVSVILPPSKELWLPSGITYDASNVSLDCAGSHLNFRGMTSGNAISQTFGQTDPNTQPEAMAVPMERCRLLGPISNSFAVNGIVNTAASGPSGSGLTYRNVSGSGFRNFFVFSNGNFDITLDTVSYNHISVYGSGTFVDFIGTSNAGERINIVNGWSTGQHFIVTQTTSPNCEFFVSNTTADGAQDLFTGDNGGGPGSAETLCQFYAKSNFHVENLQDIGHAINIGADGGSFNWDGGSFLGNSGLTHAPCNNDSSSINGGVSIKNIVVSIVTSTDEYFCDGAGPMHVSDIAAVGPTVNQVQDIFNSINNNDIPNFTFPVTPIALWNVSGGGITYDTTTATGGGTPAPVGSIKMITTGGLFQDAFFCSPAKQGDGFSSQFYYRTANLVSGGGSMNISFQWKTAAHVTLITATPIVISTDATNWTASQKAVNGKSLGRAPAGTGEKCMDFTLSPGTSSTFWFTKPMLSNQ